jgi:hypothetical protein
VKWDPPTATVQWSADKRYIVVEANSKDWVAYEATPFQTAMELGVKSSAAEARKACEDHEEFLVSMRKRA